MLERRGERYWEAEGVLGRGGEVLERQKITADYLLTYNPQLLLLVRCKREKERERF